jgi:hypothetical protein
VKSCNFLFGGSVDLTENDIWPDGDAPDDWTAEDVEAVIVECGGAVGVLRGWELDGCLTLRVYMNRQT